MLERRDMVMKGDDICRDGCADGGVARDALRDGGRGMDGGCIGEAVSGACNGVGEELCGLRDG
jgi:hypothetical protein